MSGSGVEAEPGDTVMSNEAWKQRWVDRNIAFHQDKPDPYLAEEEARMFGGQPRTVFQPLCGKTTDMIWMWERGHTVVGVEVAEQGVREFFEENGLTPESEAVENVGTQYTTKDGRLRLYAADLFNLSMAVCGQFDVIYDRRSLVAINTADHRRYRDLLLSLMKPDGVYYLSVLEYDPAVWPGPPHSIGDSLVRDLYGEQCNIDLVLETDRSGKNINDIAMKTTTSKEAGSIDAKHEDETKPEPETKPKLSSAGAAIKSSSYVLDRWYRMTLKQ
ncbi:probable thiopurine S-methyltransferase [Mya arenaria]|uniref:probable thiopurine S-methyltransferase n=1 Tax=Mya arenaria TaxID=6604 RepID=UPI0022E2A9F2|nr:probable thiopurine S-methyltransferase [Mya arenaria]